ncbi:hypothetical protein [Fusobacterium necrophorum]|uniref:Uncharacterized protein n=2 Tax=Fusobacterium necrophorum TaxID=859 RepID=A0AAN3VX83_9FUSO|nr:hypothetical protein [Fusobacterium necrophorum]AYV94675.1 hypothetical protein BWX37_03160 [Fusobacterium necrophorum subsp. funduliforme]EJU18842.1 hypothetical protein HMPREF1127_1104 [Fusobacterium necrophorum subsp. funduliforme Fnf 1007]KYL03315.1 hypothetical protein A2J06_09270 [Fusobacterium necrophorum subsp. funduliforme]KYM40891.1 hypothetical protein A2U03_03675 [Fusobacterium necrophorum subsp. funduliforme]KYM52162.1 hypothetical protein A2U04_10100 [Fusobacterium necrophorum
MNQIVEGKVKRYQEALERTMALRCEMIEAEVSIIYAKKIMGISSWEKFMRGEVPKEKELLLKKELERVPKSIRERDKNFKNFQKAMFLKEKQTKELEEMLGEDRQKIYAVVRGTVQDEGLKQNIEKELDITLK